MSIGAREQAAATAFGCSIEPEPPCWVLWKARASLADLQSRGIPIPPTRAAQLQSEAQELHQELQELQEVHQKLQSEVQEQESATADTRGEGHGRYVVQAFSNCPFPLLRTGMASRRRRRNGIKKSKHPDKTFKLGKFVSREFKWDSVRQHRFYSANYMMLRQPMGCPICGLHDLSELCCEWLSAHCIDSLIRN